MQPAANLMALTLKKFVQFITSQRHPQFKFIPVVLNRLEIF